MVVRVEAFSSIRPTVQAEIFSDRFPLYSYLYTLRQFRRLNGVASKEIDEFVKATSGKALSVRDRRAIESCIFSRWDANSGAYSKWSHRFLSFAAKGAGVGVGTWTRTL